MGKMKKIGVCMAAVAGAAGIAGLSAKAVEGVRKKWFLRGFEAGQFTAAVKSRHDAAGIRRMGRIVSIQIPAVSLPIPVVHGHLSLARAFLPAPILPPGLRVSFEMVT